MVVGCQRDRMVEQRSLSTADPDLAVQWSERAYPTARSELSEYDQDFTYGQRWIGDERLQLVSQRVHARLRSEVQAFPFVTIGWVTRGRLTYCDDGVVTAVERSVLWHGTAPLLGDADDALVYSLALDRTQFAARARRIVGEEYALPTALLASRSDDSETARCVQLCRLALVEDIGPLVRAACFDAVVASVLELFEQRPAEVVPTCAPRAVRRAIAFMEAHAAEPITVADVAAHVGLASRTLFLQFRRSTGDTPYNHLQSFRLESCRRDLEAADPGPGVVRAVSARWGFGHPGRFAAAYAQRFGESPRDTLGRS